jgi:hypothetical protein
LKLPINQNCVLVCEPIRKPMVAFQYPLITLINKGCLKQIYTQAVKQIKVYMEQTNDLESHSSLNDLLERKGLTTEFKWILLSVVKTRFARELLMSSLLSESLERVMSMETYFKSFRNDG